MSALIKHSLLLSLLVSLLAACSPSITPAPMVNIANTNAPQTGDESLVVNTVQVIKMEVTSLESSPQQYSLKISFFKPTPCDQFRVVVNQPDANKQIDIKVYSLMKRDQVCNLMATLNPTEAIINLVNLPAGHYIVMVNGINSAEFDA